MQLTINNVDIGINENGLYSLNDLHKAAGSKNKHIPSKFYRSNNFKNIVEILLSQKRTVEVIDKKTGRWGGGTWVCEELVLKYAMWIDAGFELQVMQIFLATNKSAPATMTALNELTRKIESDKAIASQCGKELANYRKVKKENEKSWIEQINSAQFALGI